MRNIHACFIICILFLTMSGCENYDKAIQGIEKGKKLVDTTAKKVTETREEAEKSIEKLLGKETAKTDEKKDEKKSESKEINENKNKGKD